MSTLTDLTAPLLQQPLPEAEWRAARGQLEQVIRADPGNAEALTLLGVLGSRARQYPRARDWLEQAVRADPDDLEARRWLVELLVSFGDVSGARAQVAGAPRDAGTNLAWQAAADAVELLHPPAAEEKLDLQDVTFVIPFRADSSDRLRNLAIILRYLDEHLHTCFLIAEDDPGEPRFPEVAESLGELGDRCGYLQATPHPGGFIHRTRDLNLLIESARTPIVVVYDTDVLLLPAQYRQARAAVDAGAAMVLPYGGLFVDLERALVEQIECTLRVDDVDLFQHGATVLNSFSAGGAIFYDRQALLAAGGYNENFVSWGFEDLEILHRLSSLGLPIQRVPGPLYHLTHTRTGNSSERHPFYEQNRQELEAVLAMTADQIRQGVTTGRFRRRAKP